jgi:branched-chain amino acid aminotransferase
MYKDDGVFRVWLHDATDKVTIFSQPVSKYIKADKGAKVCVSAWRRVDDGAIPARGKVNGAYVNSALIKSDAVLSGYDEAIVLNQNGHVSEGSAANFMMVRDGVLITPPITDNILEGITRRTIMHLAQTELDLDVVERPIDRTELYLCDEAFFCGTGAQVTAIGSVDNRQLGDGGVGPITGQIRDLYFDVVYGRLPKYSDWLFPVPVLETA